MHYPQHLEKKFYYEKVFEFDLSSYWGLVPSKNPTTQKFRKFEELLDIFDVEKIKSPTGSSRYASKKYNAWFERLGLVDEDKRYFFPTPSKSQKLKSMRVQ